MAIISPVSGLSQASVTVNSGNVIGTNKLSFGFHLSDDWRLWRDRPALQQLTKDANFELIRTFDWFVQPCTKWNETTRSGTFNWVEVDSLMRKIFEVGAEPLVCLGWARPQNIRSYIPAGMAINSSTGLPYPGSWAAYSREWVKHFKSAGLPVRFYETMNEPWLYFGWNNYTKIAYFMAVFNAAAQAMRTENPSIMVSFDGTNRRIVLDYWLTNGGAGLDFISFHKYEAWIIEQYTDQVMLDRAETFQLKTSPGYYGIQDARKKYYDARGRWIPVLNSESNLNSAFETGSDPRIQQMVGTVWLALVLKTGILNGLDYNVYCNFASIASWERRARTSGGVGFGMVNLDDNQPWYPYYVQKLIGGNLAVGDQIVGSTSSSPDIGTVAWVHNGKLNTLVICKNDTAGAFGLKFYGLHGTLNYSKIDNSISWETPKMQNGTMDSTGSITIKGYTVALFQSSVPAIVFEDGFESGGFSKWIGTSISSGETATVSATKPYSGSYSAQFTTNAGNGEENAYCYESVNLSEVYVRGYFNISSGLPFVDNSDRLYLLRLVGGQNLVYAGIMRERGIDKWVILVRNGANWMNWKSAITPLPKMGTWVCVELHWKRDPTQGVAELYIDGSKVIAVGGINTAYYGNAIRVDAGLPYAMGVQRNIIIQGDFVKIAKTYIGT
jgi:hypothetical protein